MENELTQNQAIKFARQIMLPNFDFDKQLKLYHSSVLIIGVGGLGCSASQYLAASGVGKLTLVDDDTVETHNLPRQILYCEDNIGQFKAETAANFLGRKYPESQIIGVCKRLTESELVEQIKQHDLVLDCSDNLATRQLLNKCCYKLNVSLVSGAAIRMEGQLFCVLPEDNSACYQCFSQFFGEQQLSCHEAGVMSPIVGLIGNMQALEGIKILSNYGKVLSNVLLMFDGMQSEWVKLKVAKSSDCKVCNG